MNIKQLEIFILVADLQSFTYAARKLYMSQPAVSFQIKSLEEDLSVTLFQRGDRKVELTAAGRMLYPEAKKMVSRYRKIRSSLDELKGLKTGQLIIGASTTPGEYLLPLVIGEFCGKYPGINISLRVGGSSAVYTWIKEREIDLGITGTAFAGEGVHCEPWVQDDLVLIISSKNALGKKVEKICMTEIIRHPFVLREPGSGTRLSFERKLAEKGFDPSRLNVVMELGSARSVITAVQAGIGVGVVSLWAVQDALAAGKVVRLNHDFADMKRDLFILSRQGRESITAEFLKFLRSEECKKSL